MKKIITSLGMIVFVGAVVAGGTGAFFSDTETSTANVFTAGAIDLQIDNSSYGFDWNNPEIPLDQAIGEWGQNNNNTWALTDLTNELFFNFRDLKPGDYGEDTISLHVNNNDAYACMAFDLTGTPENGQNDPEAEVDPTDGADEGELQNYLSFLFWHDDGDNVLEEGEELIDSLSGLSSDIFSGEWLALAESSDEPFAGGETAWIGKGWCFGDIAPDPVPQDNYGAPTEDNTGFACTGAEGDHNDAQTDGINVDVSFYAVQSRNNDDFTCSSLPPLDGGDPEPREAVGAALGAYVAPTAPDCDFTVVDDESIQAANDSAATNDVICVDPSYTGVGDTFPVTLDVTNLTVAGLGSAGDADIPGGFFVDANGVTVTGLEFTDYSFIASSENAAIYIHNEPGQGAGANLTGTTISHNIFTAPGSAKTDLASGIITEIGSASAIATGISVMNNTFTDWRRGIFFNTANYEVSENDFFSNDVGVANDGPENSSIHHNNFDGNALEAIGVAPAAIGATSNDGLLTVNTNNFLPAGAGNDVNWYGSSVLGGADVDATDNWWDGEAEAARTNDIAEVDTSSPAAGIFPHN